MLRWLGSRINLPVILISLVVAFGLLLLFGLLIVMTPTPAALTGQPLAGLTVIAAPSPTPTQPPVVGTPTLTTAPSIGGISVGSYVQITGTEGVGLRLRSGAGTSNAPRFLGMDEEVFLVKDGPKTADNLTWWFLQAPYDPSRSGWAASQYLKVVSPTPTP